MMNCLILHILGRSDIEQFDIICRALGTPSENLWTGIEKLPYYDSIYQSTIKYNQTSLRTSYSGKLSDSAIDLLERILVFDPSRRSSAKILSTNKYFLIQPLPPIDPRELDPIQGSCHEFLTKHLKRQREKEQQNQSQNQSEIPIPLPSTLPYKSFHPTSQISSTTISSYSSSSYTARNSNSYPNGYNKR